MCKRFQPFSLFLIGAFLAGCSSQPAQKESKTGTPELTIQVASMNLASMNKRIEKRDIKKIVDILKREQIEILSVQAITRYPGVTTRVDFVDELAKQGDLNSAFGEMINNSGRQTVNAVFSTYPIRSKVNLPFEKIKSVKFEAAFQAMIDGGTRPVFVVSAQIPPEAPLADQKACISQISSLHLGEKNGAVIITGNLPTANGILEGGPYRAVTGTNSRDAATGMWMMSNEALRVSSIRTIETDFGPMIVAQFGLFRQMQP